MEEEMKNLARNTKRLKIDNLDQSDISVISYQKELIPIMCSENGSQIRLKNHLENSRVLIARRSCRQFLRLCCCFLFSHRIHSTDSTVFPNNTGKLTKTLVLDLDETLVHSSLKPLDNYDFKIGVKSGEDIIDIFVMLRPGAQDFLERIGVLYEVIIFTASLESYANPVIDFLDRSKVVKKRLFRKDCANHNGNFVKNLSKLGRDLTKLIIVDNSPISYSLHPYNAIAINSWYDDQSDNQLEDILKVLEILEPVDDVRLLLKALIQEKMDISPKNITLIIDSYRSMVNSPKVSDEKHFIFENL